MTKLCIVCKKQFNAKDKNRSFFQFPIKNEARKKWLDAIGRSEVAKYTHVCSDHFDKNSFCENVTRKRLLPNAVPTRKALREKVLIDEVKNKTISNINSHNRKSHEISIKDSNVKSNNTQLMNEEEDSSANKKVTNASKIKEFQESNSDSIDEECIEKNYANKGKRKSNMLECEAEVDVSKKKYFQFDNQIECFSKADFVSDEAWLRFLKFNSVKNHLASNHRTQKFRMKKKIGSLKQFISTLKEKKSNGAAECLKGLPEHVKELIIRIKEKKSKALFPAHLRNFARTLHFYSPAAYQFARQSFEKCLPRLETLNKWEGSKDYKPGVNEDIIEYVSSIVNSEAARGKMLMFNVIFDEIDIDKLTKYYPTMQDLKAFVDLGGLLQERVIEENSELASKAIVFLLVNSNGVFKTPIAYYLLNYLKSEEKAILLQHLFVKLQEKNIDFTNKCCFDTYEANKNCSLVQSLERKRL
uniref:THAP-type domain-containing protein n=2 Tax=Clastoptera arizonana TaxID=38151 RepID=A0A1B6D0X2_9HEMI